MEKKKRKQERKLLKSQNKLLAGELFHTPGSDSDSGVSQSTDSESAPFSSVQHRQPAEHTCDLRHQRSSGTEPSEPIRNSGLCPASGITRASTIQKLNPFSVESLLADSSPRRKTLLDFSQLPPQRSLVGKGHFLLYPITQPLGFIVPQTAMKTSQDSGSNCSTTDTSNPNQQEKTNTNHRKDANEDAPRKENQNSPMQTNANSETCQAESNSPPNQSEATVTNPCTPKKENDISDPGCADTHTDGEDVDMD